MECVGDELKRHVREFLLWIKIFILSMILLTGTVWLQCSSRCDADTWSKLDPCQAYNGSSVLEHWSQSKPLIDIYIGLFGPAIVQGTPVFKQKRKKPSIWPHDFKKLGLKNVRKWRFKIGASSSFYENAIFYTNHIEGSD